MQFSNAFLQSIKGDKKLGHVARAKSLDCIKFPELTPKQLQILLGNSNNNQFATTIAKQDLLLEKKLFNPFKYFGSPSFQTFEQAYMFHRPRFEEMFCSETNACEKRTPSRMVLKGSLGHKGEQPSPLPRNKMIDQSKRTMGKSPKNYVKQNKQNFMRLNLNNMQKMRLKLKISKK